MKNGKQSFFFFILMLCHLLCNGQDKCGNVDTIRGQITDHSEHLVENAKVDLFYKKAKIATCVSDSNGNFQFLGISVIDDHFWVRTKLKGYIKDESKVDSWYLKHYGSLSIRLDYDPYYMTILYCGWFALPSHDIYSGYQYRRLAH